MVRAGAVTTMTLNPVPISGGIAPLGAWGAVDLKGSSGAVLRLSWADDVELPSAVAEDITGGVLLMNDSLGRLLYLPYAGHLIVAYDLRKGALAYPEITLPRNPDHGLRMATSRVVPGGGVIYLAESTLARFREDCTLAWRKDEDLLGWALEGLSLEKVDLVAGDWTGKQERQRRALVDGGRLA